MASREEWASHTTNRAFSRGSCCLLGLARVRVLFPPCSPCFFLALLVNGMVW
jgi:hypothetical protein